MEYIPDNKEKGCRWHFAPQEGGREDGPNDAMMQNFKESPYRSLVRESIQNSLDAVLDRNKPVRVEFLFGSLNSKNFRNFFELRDHITGCAEYFSWQEKAVDLYLSMKEYFSENISTKGIGYIRISDFNTKGMDYQYGLSSSPFYAFARAAGVSSKIGQESGGSFGFGKSAYFQLSPIGTVFISSLTDEGKHVFEGVSWLCTHTYRGEKVSSVGYYDNNGGQPVTDVEKIPNRFKREEPGTNFYVLGHSLKKDGDEKYEKTVTDEMIKETLRSFWMAIYGGKLEVTIDKIEINAANLSSLLKGYFPEEIDDTSKRNFYYPLPYFKAVSEQGINSKVQKFTEELPILGECTFYLIKVDCPKDKLIYMRRPLMLVYAKRTQTSYGVFGVFVCSNTEGDKILKNLENPAHDEWKASNWRDARGRIIDIGSQALDEIYEFRQRCFAALFSNSQETALEITGLEDVLYVPEDLIVVDEKPETDHGQGTPTGHIKDEGLSLTTDINEQEDIVKQNEDTSNIGSVKITTTGSTDDYTDHTDDEGSKMVGNRSRTKHPAKNRGGKPRAGDNFKKVKINSDGGEYREYIPVEFRVVAQNEGGKFYHNLIIHAPHEIPDGDIEIVTIGEQTDDAVDLENTNNGTIEMNMIRNAYLKEGRNTIKVLFTDNMRHAIKLKAYENK